VARIVFRLPACFVCTNKYRQMTAQLNFSTKVLVINYPQARKPRVRIPEKTKKKTKKNLRSGLTECLTVVDQA
jgi:hypothetical protein